MSDEFLDDVKRIMAGDAGMRIVEVSTPASRGWLRRREFDTETLEAWETPAGAICGVRRRR